TPESIQLFAERIGVSKADSWIDYSTLEGALRDDLDPKAARAMAVLDPVKLVIENWEDVFGSASHLEDCSAPVHPHAPERGRRSFKLGKDIWVERSDYEETPSKGFFRLFPGNKVRLKYGYVIECLGATTSGADQALCISGKIIPETKSGTPGAETVKVKGVITWVAAADALPAQVRLYDRLFSVPQPGSGGADFLQELNAGSLSTVTACVEPSLASAAPESHFQFERHGYFVADRVEHGAGKLVFNRAVGLKDSWGKS
ncbi:MAG: hypothetical protein RLZZ126_1209, partial [Pseudomonadota bacterium]